MKGMNVQVFISYGMCLDTCL